MKPDPPVRSLEEARAAMAEFRFAWFEKKGGSREEAVALAARADRLLEELSDDLFYGHERETTAWCEELLNVPEIEKAWFGRSEYRRFHRVLGVRP